MATNHKHFKGEKVVEHLKTARERGAKATAEVHGTEPSGSLSAGADSAKETAILFLGLWILLSAFAVEKIFCILGVLAFGWFLWKVGRSSLLGWARLERLHRLIEQERWEIQHHRNQEKEELIAMYEQKGFSGQLLNQVVEILMADDNRLLRVMLEEELGLTLESYEHPLKQSMGAGIGVLVAIVSGILGCFISGFFGVIIALSCVFFIAAIIASKLEGNELIRALVWNLSIGILSVVTMFLLIKWIIT